MLTCRYLCHYGALTGYGRAARDYVAALQRVEGVQLEIAVLGDNPLSPEPRYSYLDCLAVPFRRVVGVPDVEVYHTTPHILAHADQLTHATTRPSLNQRAPKRVALTTWETNRIPEYLAEALDRFDACIVPSEFCHDVICDRIAPPVEIVPHCFDEAFWPSAHALYAAHEDRREDQPYRFYAIGQWGERKNMLGVIRAYLSAFSKRDRVQLALLIENADFDEIRSVIARSGLSESELPEIIIPDAQQTGALTELDLVGFHAGGDCFVSATRGEGWGLGLFEAAIMGRRVITPLYGGHVDFLDDYAWTDAVPYQMTPCFGGETRMRVDEHEGQRVQVSKVAIPPGVNCRQSWADPDLCHLAGRMRSIYERHDEGEDDSDLADHLINRSALEAKFGYKTVGPMLAKTLREIATP